MQPQLKTVQRDVVARGLHDLLDGGQLVVQQPATSVCLSDRELIYCTGGSNTVILIDLADFSSFRIIDERPHLREQVKAGRQAARQVLDVLTRGSALASTKHFLAALRVSRGTLIDGVYACQLSADQTLLFTANRGLNTVTVYDYPGCTVRLRVKMPDLHDHVDGLHPWSDPRLGFHHGALISPPPKAERA